ncbi:sugar transferase [Gemmatirosa kalamazoonensis]|uniref:sugar transferase n=1 Tax=Gemmatirosa kalamazoonensis TaxID=861299 RepID=UPI00046D5C64|nr:sugar transferase [Gemmatirosa kalamazoonensis]
MATGSPSIAFDTPVELTAVSELPHFGVPEQPSAVIPAERWEVLTRVVNVVIAGIALLVLAPICVLVAIVVKLTSPGPVFYTQTRVGADRRWNRTTALNERRIEDLGGQPFTILKFRSMRTDAEANGQAVWATKHDARVTPVGRVLRKTRLDELPQLINVLRGEMNIVGPRPERPSIVVRLRNDIPEYPFRHRVKPGITGWAQINHSYDSCLEDVRKKVHFDLEYIANQSLWFDFKIMVLTLPVMLFRKGAH